MVTASNRWLPLLLSILCVRCSASADTPYGPADLLGAPDMLAPARPFEILVPPQYDGSKPTPLLILLHGYSQSGSEIDAYFGLQKTAQDQGFLYAFPDGTKDETSLRFWNATDGCCNMYGAQVDDVGYLKSLIKTAQTRYNVDPKKIFLVGYSNGGFMAYRMACDVAAAVAGIVSLAGATWLDPSHCLPSGAVAVLEVHGDMDPIINYNGGHFGDSPAAYPAAHATVGQWAHYDGCTGALTDSGIRLDIDAGIPGAETRVERYGGCPQSAVELWTLQGSGHFPDLQPSWGSQIYQFLTDHPKP